MIGVCVPIDSPIAPLLVEEAAAAGFGVVLLTISEAIPPPPPAMTDPWAALEATGTVAAFHFGTTGTGLSLLPRESNQKVCSISGPTR